MGEGARASLGWVDEQAEQAAAVAAWDAPVPRRDWIGMAAGLVLAALAIFWVAGLAWNVARATPAGAGDPLRLAAWIGLGSGPLAVFAMLYLLLVRNGRSEVSAYARASARLRTDSENLAAMLTLLNARVGEARAGLTEQAEALSAIGTESGERMTRAGASLRAEAEAFAGVARALDDATATARADLGVLVTDLPDAEALAERVARLLREGASAADGHGRTLTELLAALETQARAAGETTAGAAARLAGQLDRVEASAAAADKRIEEAASSFGRTIDASMAVAADALEEARGAIADQSAAIEAMVAQSRATAKLVGNEATRGLATEIEALMARIEDAGAALRGQEQAGRAMLGQLEAAIDAVHARFAVLGDTGAEHTADLAEAIVALAGHADAVGRTLGASGERAETVLARVIELRQHADASAGAIGDTIPAALSRIRLHAEQSLQAISTAGAQTESMAEVAATVSGRLAEAEAILDRQRAALDGAGTEASERLIGLTAQAETLQALLAQADSDVRGLSEGASGQLVEALVRVRDVAAQASDQARDAISSAIPRAAQRLGESAARAMQATIAEVGRGEMAAIGAASERAVDGARAAAERLSRHLLTIAETSTAIEARIEANRVDTEAHDEAGFARQLGLMIEALNSTSIDVTRILASEVSDTAWVAYLKGDRGIFTRRAVRLLEAGEARAIAERHGQDGEFREQVNRYVHDFEAMLRRTLAVKEGTSVATTLLSSDVGKLYVALAQAIERLR